MDSDLIGASKRGALELDIDARLAEVWFRLWERNEGVDGDIGGLLRLAYGRGYCDALTESERGQLCRDHGLAIPTRQRAA